MGLKYLYIILYFNICCHNGNGKEEDKPRSIPANIQHIRLLGIYDPDRLTKKQLTRLGFAIN